MRVRKLTNTSKMQLQVVLEGGPTVFLLPGDSLENVKVDNFFSIKQYTHAIVDATEVYPQPPKGRRQYLKS